MIIVKLIGGLGNQMFQYSAGRRAAYINNSELKLDTSWFEYPERAIKRDYSLNIFNITGCFANKEKINKLKGVGPNLLTKLIKPYYKRSYVKQRYFHFDPNILKILDNTYLEGSWQSEKYFSDIGDIIRKEFTLKNKPNKTNNELIRHIKNCNSVSIHVRRRDYVSDKKTHDFHGICGLDYYRKAISLFKKKFANPHFFIFSDDPDWCRKNLQLKYPTDYVIHNLGKRDYEDMRLMNSCKHNIIANSSFSWWGAWLNIHPDKIVIAPKNWFNDKTINTRDLIPKLWSLI